MLVNAGQPHHRRRKDLKRQKCDSVKGIENITRVYPIQPDKHFLDINKFSDKLDFVFGIIIAMLLYVSECWTISLQMKKRLVLTEM